MIISKLKKILGFTFIGLIPVTFFSYSSVHNNINLTKENSQPQSFSYYKPDKAWRAKKAKRILDELRWSNHKGLSKNNDYNRYFKPEDFNPEELDFEENHKIRITDQGELEILIKGVKQVVYWGGLFWQDKAAWLGRSEIQYTKKRNFSNYYNYNADEINLKTHSWISGLATPSFVINGNVAYATDKREVTAEIGASVKFEFNSYELIEAFEKRNANRLVMNYQGVGWNYKISNFGQYAAGLVIDDYEYTSIATNNPLIPDKSKSYRATTLPYYIDNRSKF
ncbi:hypothetical protein R7V45_00910 [Mesomycoplasma ovipneumoniae]|uniref:Uncharacterized protein n=1 Tax=Mesomycoplasma ovipneumoniae TaxID=29562 RepID=A0AAJ2P7S1_9BACT|nr:hypothetical protein [Mesomycoplasma ovipneumoniae]MDW2829767.1 hypothetical protein [Mesomycoplasma ovipneumoniae]MDW2834134.1 hypothetical protein [Mesomycoplasma ovipneumoniae]MDW2870695.1 hypothetical protein [Mesomycoplasma ovipneumoniae]MDW2892198.1 hypothetical protein [Mesomycoplasma ovipneumoniae]MDW2893094.1 hypothetical protein [Mesomycoplasma ovipneumoniae]